VKASWRFKTSIPEGVVVGFAAAARSNGLPAAVLDWRFQKVDSDVYAAAVGKCHPP